MSDYLEACATHAHKQGLGPAALMLSQSIPPIPFGLDQTGGMTMCISIPLEVDPEFRWIWVTADEFDHGDPTTFCVGLYDSSDETEGGECVEHTICELDTLLDVVRKFRQTPRQPPKLQALVRCLDLVHDMLKDTFGRELNKFDASWYAFGRAKVAELGALVQLLSREVPTNEP